MRVSTGYRIVRGLAWCLALYLVLPLFVAFPVSLTNTDYLSLPSVGDLSLHHYETLMTPSERWLRGIFQSILVALGTACLATVLGTLGAIGIWRLDPRLSEAVLTFALIPIVIPSVVLALGEYRIWSRLGLYDTFAGTIIAHTTFTLPFVVIAVLVSLSRVDANLSRAAHSLGASVSQFLRYVLIPTIRPGVLSGVALAFLISWDELILTIFLTGRNVQTLPKRMWEAIRDDTDPVVAAVSTLLVLLTAALLTPWLLRRRDGTLRR